MLGLASVSTTNRLPLDGRDAWASITTGTASPHDDILINITTDGGALQADDWKIVVNGNQRDADESEGEGGGAPKKATKKKAAAKAAGAKAQIELFNLTDDPYEKTNLAEKNPEMMKKLRARLDAYAKAAVPSKQTPRATDFKVPTVWGEQ